MGQTLSVWQILAAPMLLLLKKKNGLISPSKVTSMSARLQDLTVAWRPLCLAEEKQSTPVIKQARKLSKFPPPVDILFDSELTSASFEVSHYSKKPQSNIVAQSNYLKPHNRISSAQICIDESSNSMGYQSRREMFDALGRPLRLRCACRRE